MTADLFNKDIVYVQHYGRIYIFDHQETEVFWRALIPLRKCKHKETFILWLRKTKRKCAPAIFPY